MEIILNELSVNDLSGTVEKAKENMNQLMLVCKKVKEELGCNGLRLPNANFFNVELVPGYTLINWMNDHSVNRNLKTLFNGLRRYPYFENLNEKEEEEYILSKFYLNEPRHPSDHKEVQGLANAWLKNTLSISFCSHPVWSKNKIGISIEKGEEGAILKT